MFRLRTPCRRLPARKRTFASRFVAHRLKKARPLSRFSPSTAFSVPMAFRFAGSQLIPEFRFVSYLSPVRWSRDRPRVNVTSGIISVIGMNFRERTGRRERTEILEIFDVSILHVPRWQLGGTAGGKLNVTVFSRVEEPEGYLNAANKSRLHYCLVTRLVREHRVSGAPGNFR